MDLFDNLLVPDINGCQLAVKLFRLICPYTVPQFPNWFNQCLRGALHLNSIGVHAAEVDAALHFLHHNSYKRHLAIPAVERKVPSPPA
jgi:hypothetical protein